MLRKVIFVMLPLLIYFLSLVNSERILFKQGYIKYARRGRRDLFYNVTAIDDKIIDTTKRFVLVKTKLLPDLHYQSVRNLPNLQDLVVASCNIRSLAPGAFLNLPNLTSVHLHDNLIVEIKNSVFSGLPVSVLLLQRNLIKKIESEAFDDMPNLRKIKLNNNKLKAWDSNWFKNTPKLTEFYFKRNRIRYLPPYAFSNITRSPKSDTKIFLSKNKLGVITPESFYNLTRLSQLYLDRNNLTDIPDDAFRDLEEVDVIYFTRNKIYKISEKALPKVKRMGILDLSNNLLKCLPYRLVSLANLTNLDKNDEDSCECVSTYKQRLKQDSKNNEIICVANLSSDLMLYNSDFID